MSLEIIRVASSQTMLNGASVSSTGRVFASFPRWSDQPTPGVCEAMSDGTFKPFPGGDWNIWQQGRPAQSGFISVHATFVDHEDNLWVVDDAAPFHKMYVPDGPKLVKINLKTNAVDRVYPLDETLAPPGTVLGHVRRDADFAYVTDAYSGALTVINLQTGKGRRLLSNHPKMKADPTITPVVEGVPLRQRDGSPVIINVNLLEISADRTWIYFMPLFGPWLRRVRTKDLRDVSLSETELGARIEDIVQVPPCAGIAADKNGNLFLSSFTEFAIRKLKPDLTWETVITDPRVCCPNEGEVGVDGYFYFPASQFARGGQFQPNGIPRYQLPFELLKVKVG